jgi:carbonic anhydrase
MRKRMRGIVIAAVLVLGAVSIVGVSAHAYDPASAPAGSSGGFTYNGDTGPGFWADLDPANTLCGSGTSQSPINISHVKIDPSLGRLKLALQATPISLVNNGHAIEEEVETPNTLTLNGVVYTSSQFHFHTLSEHAVGGRRGVMELHAVFVDRTGRAVVVGMLFTIGHKNGFLDELASAGLPRHTGDDAKSETAINLADGLTDTSQYYTYAGSLTTPPCTEGVTWFVLKDEAQLSTAQFQSFQDILGNDFRPLQSLNGRAVYATARGGKPSTSRPAHQHLRDRGIATTR